MKKIIGIVTPILLLILPYLLFVVLSVGMGRPDRDSSGAYIMAGDSRLQMTQTAICIVYVVVVLLNVVWVICQTAAGTSAQTLLLWDIICWRRLWCWRDLRLSCLAESQLSA